MTKELQIEPKDIFKITKEGYVLLGANPITKEEVSALQEEIKFLEKTRIWSIMTNGVCDLAKQIMFEKAQTFEDMRTGKAMLKNVELMKNTMIQIKNLQIVKPKPSTKVV
jgi:hypothetical protein